MTIAKNDGSSKLPVTYKFLAGFKRHSVKWPLPTNQEEAVRLLYDSPHQAILLMMKQIIKSKDEANHPGEKLQGPFAKHLEQLEDLKGNSSIPGFYGWVVGLDLFGDELGYPYCPFVERQFIQYVKGRQDGTDGYETNDNFGLRIHCGENVIFADNDSPAYRLFIAHMYIVFRCLRFLQGELKKGIRIGHGIAFDRILGTSMKPFRHRKSSVLLAEMRDHANYLFKTIAFEVNITSNEYLLGQILRQGDLGQVLRLDALFKLNANIILATDDDGIWPLDQCKFSHPGHHSLSAEYCRAITSSMFSLVNEQEEKKAADRLRKILKDTPKFCFSNMKDLMPKQSDEDLLPSDDLRNCSIIVHPDIIRRLLEAYEGMGKPHLAFGSYKVYIKDRHKSPDNIVRKSYYGEMRVAFICIYAHSDVTEETKKEEIKAEYLRLFAGPNQSKSTEDEFEFIYRHWKEVYSEFLSHKDVFNGAPHVKIESPGNRQRKHVIYSEPPIDNLQQLLRSNLEKSLQKKLHTSLQDSLQKPLEDALQPLLEDGVHPTVDDTIKTFLKNSLQTPLQASVQESLRNILEQSLQDKLQQLIQDQFIKFLEKLPSKKCYNLCILHNTWTSKTQ